MLGKAQYPSSLAWPIVHDEGVWNLRREANVHTCKRVIRQARIQPKCFSFYVNKQLNLILSSTREVSRLGRATGVHSDRRAL